MSPCATGSIISGIYAISWHIFFEILKKMRASRLLRIQMRLKLHSQMSASDLARTLDISIRTLHRDVDELTAAGVPIYAERGRSGGFRLLDGWRPAMNDFTIAEVQALFLCGLVGPAEQLGLAHDVEAARMKILASLPINLQDQAERVSSRLHLDVSEWYRHVDAALPHLHVVASALWSDHRVIVVYRSWKGIVRRTLD